MRTAKIQISNILEKYIRKIFNSESSGRVRITRQHPVGRFIIANVSWSKEKPSAKHDGNMEFNLPDDPRINYDKMYGYFKKIDERSVINFIQSYFDLDVQMFYMKGYLAGFTQTDITFLCIKFYNLPLTDNVVSLLKKRDYRKRKKTIDIKMDILQNM
jgi:hypothetical protein